MSQQKSMTAQQISNLFETNQAVHLGFVGIQRLPVYDINGEVYVKAIHFDDGYDHSDYYQVSSDRALELKQQLQGDKQ